MPDNLKEIDLMIFPSLHEEAKEGWVWLPKEFKGWEGSVIEITNLENGKSIVCECRVIDDNFTKIYTKENCRVTNKDRFNNYSSKAIVINAYYRKRLDLNSPEFTKRETVVRFKIELVDNQNFFFRNCKTYVKSAWQHPNVYVRNGIVLAVVSVCLALVALIVSFISLIL